MDSKARVLVIDDDPLIRRSCGRILEQGYDVRFAASGTEGLAMLNAGSFDLALIDLKLPDVSGMDILRQVPDRFPGLPVIIMTGYSTVKSAVEAIKIGAYDYLAKPFTPDELDAAVEKALRQRRLLLDYRKLQDELADRYEVARLIGQSAAMQRVLDLIRQVAPTDSTVLITGPSGTGKELAARAIHFSSPRRDARFVAVDCGAIAPNLVASELFGHVRGAFTGATEERRGLIQDADGGSLFLDEVGNLPLDLQATLLRVIETGEVRPVGTSDSTRVNVRYIAAANRDLDAMAAEGTFRHDLLYRLKVFPILMPPLRQRPEDIPLLARHFLAKFCARMHKRIDDFTPEAIRVLTEYDWPGNVRELSNVVERLVIVCGQGRVGQAHLHETMALAVSSSPAPQTAAELYDRKKTLRDQAVEDLEKAFLLEALRRNDYSVTRAADQTGMQRSHLQSLLKKHNLRIKDLVSERDHAEHGPEGTRGPDRPPPDR